MNPLTSDKIRQKFVEYFKGHGHTDVPSSSLIPEGKDLLFTNAGMYQFKDIFLGLKKPPYKRAVTVQKCFRANDLDQVGRTPRHHTFFEMLGNFSFGDYFKKEAIEWAWEFLTHPDWLGIDKSRLYVTVYDTDDEAYDLWKQVWQKDQDEIKKSQYEFIKKDKENFWKMGSVGPCGPCSEIFYNCGGQDSQSQDVEIWNLVFTQFDRQKDGSLKKLVNGPFIDTGAGLERLTAVVQGVESNFETDIFMDLFGYLLEEKIIVAAIRTWKKNIQPKNESEAKMQDENIRQVFDGFLKDLSDHLQLENKSKMDGSSRDFFMFYVGEFQIKFKKDILKKLDTAQRKALIDFLCEELQKDRTLREDTENYKQNLLRQNIDKNKKKQDRIVLFKIADHTRAIAYLLKDEVTFSDEGRGYVARDIFDKMCKCLNQIGISIIASTRYHSLGLPECNYYTPCFLVNCFIQKLIQEPSSLEEKKRYRFIMNLIVNETIRYTNKDEMKERDHQIYSNLQKIKNKEKEIKQSEEKIQKAEKEIEEKKKKLQKTSHQTNKNESILIAEQKIKDIIRQKENEIKEEQEKIKKDERQRREADNENIRLKQKQEQALQEAQEEEKKQKEDIFNKEFDKEFDKEFQNQTPSTKALGTFAFKCYETYGISKEDIKQLLQKRNIQLDDAFDKAFDSVMKKAQEQSKKASSQEYLASQEEHLKKLCRGVADWLRQTGKQAIGPSGGQTGKQVVGQSGNQAGRQTGKQGDDKHFLGYETLSAQSQILKLSDGQQEVQELQAGQEGFAIFNQTPFYAESGGQIADQGTIQNASEDILAEVMDCQKYEDVHYHKIHIKKNALKVNDQVTLQVYPERRAETKKHHTATHLLHAALKNILEDHVTQRGSLVAEDHLRFDFTHSKPVQEISQIETLINQQISQALTVTTTIEKVEEAKARGAVAFFAEKYPEKVRVLTIGHNKESIELCGGTHVNNTSEIQAFVITSEESIKGGVRRIKALAGQTAIKYLLKNSKKFIAAQQEAQTDDLAHWIQQSKQNNKYLNRQVQKLTAAQIDVDSLIAKATQIEGGRQVKVTLDMADREILRQITDRIKNKLDAGIVIVIGQGEKAPLMVAVTQNLKDKYNAVTELKKYGQGGGRSDFAQGFKLS